MRKELISGFADEASKEFAVQLETLKKLGMKYLCIRALDGHSVIDVTEEEAENYINPKLAEYGLKVSSLGSPIGKIPVDDEDAFATQCAQLETLCKVANILDCKFIRLFSFYYPKDSDPNQYYDVVIAKLRKFEAICRKYDVVPMHENEKGIFGDTGVRCQMIHRAMNNTTLVCCYDFANFVQCDQDTMECYELLRPWIHYVHIKDARYSDHTVVLAGTGEGRLKDIFTLLKDSGYDGHLTMEPHLRTFASLKNLEATVEEKTVVDGLYKDGVEAFSAQYAALCGLMDEIGVN